MLMEERFWQTYPDHFQGDQKNWGSGWVCDQNERVSCLTLFRVLLAKLFNNKNIEDLVDHDDNLDGHSYFLAKASVKWRSFVSLSWVFKYTYGAARGVLIYLLISLWKIRIPIFACVNDQWPVSLPDKTIYVLHQPRITISVCLISLF